MKTTFQTKAKPNNQKKNLKESEKFNRNEVKLKFNQIKYYTNLF